MEMVPLHSGEAMPMETFLSTPKAAQGVIDRRHPLSRLMSVGHVDDRFIPFRGGCFFWHRL